MCSEWPTCFCLLPNPNSTAIQKMFLAIHLSLSKNVQVFIEIIPLSLTNTCFIYDPIKFYNYKKHNGYKQVSTDSY